jgi:release factor glutamine methyltransferase
LSTQASFDEVVAQLRRAGCVYAEEEAAMLSAAAESDVQLRAMAQRRVDGEPLEYIVGYVDFLEVRVAVDTGTFVPRVRSEYLAALAASMTPRGATVLDMCCGVGAIGLVIASRVADIRLVASDLDAGACSCARTNLAPFGGEVFAGDLYDPLPRSLSTGIDVIVANAPYVPTAEIQFMPREARLYESLSALDGGRDGLDLQRRIIAGAPTWLAPQGRLLIETGAHQAERTASLFRNAGLGDVNVHHDEEYEATVVSGVFTD